MAWATAWNSSGSFSPALALRSRTRTAHRHCGIRIGNANAILPMATVASAGAYLLSTPVEPSARRQAPLEAGATEEWTLEAVGCPPGCDGITPQVMPHEPWTGERLMPWCALTIGIMPTHRTTSRRVPVYDVERWRSPAAASGSDVGADAIPRQLDALVRCGASQEPQREPSTASNGLWLSAQHLARLK